MKNTSNILILIVFMTLSCSLWEYDDPSNPLEQKTPETYLSLIATDTIFRYPDPATGGWSYDLGNSPDPNQILLDTLENAFTDTFTSRHELHWWGEDSDGEVIGYQYRWDVDTVWSFTTKESGIFYVPILTNFDVFRFEVAAMDNDGLLDTLTPAKVVFPIKNSPPEISFRFLSNPLSEHLPNPNIHYTFPTRTFSWNLDDVDGVETIVDIFYSLDDTCETCWATLDATMTSSVTLDSISVGEHTFFLKAQDVAGAYSQIIHFPDGSDDAYPGTWIVKEPIGTILLVDDYPQDTPNNALEWYQSILDTIENVGGGGYSVWEIGEKLPADKDVTANLSYFDHVIWYSGYTGGFTYDKADGSISAFIQSGGNLFLNFATFSDSTFQWFPIDELIPISGDITIGNILLPQDDRADTLVIAGTIPVDVKGFESSDPDFQSLYRLQEPSDPENLWTGTPNLCGMYQNQSPLYPNSGKAVIMSIPLYKSQSSTLDFIWEIQNDELNSDFSAMIFVDTQTGWIVGDDGKIMKTTNGGSSWMDQNTSTSEDLLSVDFTTSTNGWIVGKNGIILNTQTGGQDWELQSSPTTKRLYSVDFVNENTGWISGYSGTILYSNDGGETWSPQESGTTKRLENIFFLNSLIGWCVGYSGTILHTENGGETWSPQESGTGNSLHAIYLIDELAGWIVGKDGIVLKTTDGGNNWVELDSGIESTLNDIYFLNSDVGWAVGKDGIIIATYNGGEDWIDEYSGVLHDLLGIQIFNAQDGKILGQDSQYSVLLNRNVRGGSGNFFNFLLNELFQ
ncbi:MAG: YCF48-related protein [Candidatus Neomarinimicrobiota bacterium]|jgi:photosystem II stability/assembly factor-like uncharacterized protein|nr:YCF48-related protein [Candidatus Neomarinimicrobiota bacterium]